MSDRDRSDKSIQRRFRRFHAANPQVYRLLVRFARQARNSGMRRYSVWALFNRLRWHVQIDNGSPDFKLNNDFISRYARMLMQREPELKGFFELRRLKVQ